MHNYVVDDQDCEAMKNPGYEENNQESAPNAPPKPLASGKEIPAVQNPIAAYEHTYSAVNKSTL